MTDAFVPPYRCDDCGKRFKEQNGLDQHRMHAHGVLPPNRGLPCPHCKRAFRDENGLVQHIAMKHLARKPLAEARPLADGRLGCPYCASAFADQSGVYSHVRDKHRGRAHAHLRPARDDDESLADIAVEAALNRAMGIPLDPLEESLLNE